MTPEMKVPRSRNPLVVKARILDAAQREFMAEGYAGASTNRIFEMFGGSKPTVFKYFPSKRALFDGVVARIAARWTEEIKLDSIVDADVSVWLVSFGLMALRWILAADNIFVGRMAIAEGAAFPEVAEIYRSLAVMPIEAALTEKLREWTAVALLQSDEPERDATSFLDLTLSGLVSRALYRVQEHISDAELQHHVNHCVGLFLNGRIPR